MKIWTLLLIAVVLFGLAACAPPVEDEPTLPPPQPTDTPEPPYGEAQPLVDQARQELAAQLGMAIDQITVVSVEPFDFPDSSLGVPLEGEMYLTVITPGYVIILEADGQRYEFHGSGDRLVMVPLEDSSKVTPPGDDYGEAQPLVDLAKADLAAQLNMDPSQITAVSVEPYDFSDSSLGVPEPGQNYLTVITPGYIILLEANDLTYEYHGSGDRVVQAPGPADTGLAPGSGDYGPAQPLVDRALAELAAQLGIDPDQISVASVEAVDFPDSSLGLPKEGESYLTVITPGYIIILEAGGQTFEFHGSGDRLLQAF